MNSNTAMIKQLLFLSFILVSLTSCENSENLTAGSIIDEAIFKSGTYHFANARVKFDFRDISYTSHGECGNFLFKREFIKDLAIIIDEFDQKTLKRKVNQQQVTLVDSLANLYAESINSVFYFVQLPYRLNDKATQKKLIGTENIKGKDYHKIKVSFEEEGGGEDFEDTYIYWINKTNFKVDYLAYSFLINGGGVRFREAVNFREVNHIQFADYRNYKLNKNEKVEVENLGKLYENGKLKLVSTIKKTKIEVELLENGCE